MRHCEKADLLTGVGGNLVSMVRKVDFDLRIERWSTFTAINHCNSYTLGVHIPLYYYIYFICFGFYTLLWGSVRRLVFTTVTQTHTLTQTVIITRYPIHWMSLPFDASPGPNYKYNIAMSHPPSQISIP